MKKQEASALVERLAARWPGLDIQVTPPTKREDGEGYALVLTLNYRHVRLMRESELAGLLGLCTAFLGEGTPGVPGVADMLPVVHPHRATELSQEDIAAICESYGPYRPGPVGKRSLRGERTPSMARLAAHYHVSIKRILHILRSNEAKREEETTSR